jgi:flavin reductase (DIM6/NTAB) family NADH-FMN oxidoreductase RutF
MTGSVVPRPIGWISTRSKEGAYNLAPFSYFNAVSSDPPTLMFSSGMRGADTPKDTLKNARDTGEFVANIVTADLAEAMNTTAVDAPPGTSEFELAGVTPSASVEVAAPRVLESPIHFECKVSHVLEIGSNILVFGQIVHIQVDDGVLVGGDKIDIEKLRPVGRLAGSGYVHVSDLFDMERPAYSDAVVRGEGG